MESMIEEVKRKKSVGSVIRAADPGLLLIMALAALLGLLYNAVIFIGYGPDELRHMAYIQILFEERKFPFLLPDGTEYRGAHTLHPPFYYFTLLPLYALSHLLPENFVWHVVRLGSLLISLTALPLVYQIACCIKSNNRNLARLATAHIALLPMFGMTAGTINNDSAAFLAVIVFIWLLCVKYPLEKTIRSALMLGVCLGLGLMCKFNVLLCDGIALVVYLLAQDGWRAWRMRAAWLRLLTTLGVGVMIALPWHLRNLAVYGAFAPIPPPMANPTNGDFSMVFHPDFTGYLATAAWGIICTFWTQKDWIPEALRSAVYIALGAYCALGVIGLLRRSSVNTAMARAAEAEPENIQPAVQRNIALWCSGSVLLINYWAVLHGAMFLTWGWAQGGRYIFPSAVGFGVIGAYGWGRLVKDRLSGVLAVYMLGMLALNGLCLYWLLAYLNPTFGPKG